MSTPDMQGGQRIRINTSPAETQTPQAVGQHDPAADAVTAKVDKALPELSVNPASPDAKISKTQPSPGMTNTKPAIQIAAPASPGVDGASKAIPAASPVDQQHPPAVERHPKIVPAPPRGSQETVSIDGTRARVDSAPSHAPRNETTVSHVPAVARHATSDEPHQPIEVTQQKTPTRLQIQRPTDVFTSAATPDETGKSQAATPSSGKPQEIYTPETEAGDAGDGGRGKIHLPAAGDEVPEEPSDPQRPIIKNTDISATSTDIHAATSENDDDLAIDQAVLTSSIRTGIKAHLLMPQSITYRTTVDKDEIGRECFLITPDGQHALSIAFWHSEVRTADYWNIKVNIINMDSNPPSGYLLSLDNSGSEDENWIEFFPYLSELPANKEVDNTYAAAYGLTYDETVDDNLFSQNQNKRHIRNGLLLIEKLLETAIPDEAATKRVKAWMKTQEPGEGVLIEEDGSKKPINLRKVMELVNNVSVNTLFITVAEHVDSILSNLAGVVNEAFSEKQQ